MRKLNLNRDQIDDCLKTAARIVSHARKYIDRHSTRSIEIATLQWLGLRGSWRGRLLADGVVSRLSKDQLRLGAAFWWGLALLHGHGAPDAIAESVARGKWALDTLPHTPFSEIRKALEQVSLAQPPPGEARKNGIRELFPNLMLGYPADPFKKVVARARRQKEAGVVLVWPSPKEALRETLPAEGKESWPYRCRWFQKEAADRNCILSALGGHAAEIMAQLRDVSDGPVCLDTFANVLSYKMYPQKSFVEGHFALGLARAQQRKIATAGFLWLHHLGVQPQEILAHPILQEQFFLNAGLDRRNLVLLYPLASPSEKMAISSIALAQICREVFAQEQLGCQVDSLPSGFAALLATLTTHDFLFFMTSEPPFLQEVLRYRDLYRDLGSTLHFDLYGKVAREAHGVLEGAWKHLKKIEHQTFWKYLGTEERTAGQDDLFQIDRRYFNPVRQQLLCPKSESF